MRLISSRPKPPLLCSRTGSSQNGGNPLRHRSGEAVKVQRIGAEILTILPLNAAQDWSHGVEVSLILQLSEDTDIQVRLDVKYLDFAVREGEHEGVISVRLDRDNSGFMLFAPLLLQRVNREDRLTLAGKEPVGHEIFAVNFDPRLHQP